MSQQLFIFQIGPVQSFIASARRTQDLYIGSRMLSMLASAGVEEAAKTSAFQPIFPMIVDGKLPQGVPHRFAFIADDDAQTVAGRVQDAIFSTWQTQFVDRVHAWLAGKIGGGKWELVYERQTANWLEFNWVAVPYDAGNHSESYGQASRLLAARRGFRTFAQVEEDGHKCTLTGSQSQLPLDWEALHREMPNTYVLRPNEKLGAIALIKRFAGRHFANCGIDDQDFPSMDDIAGTKNRDKDGQQGKDVNAYVAVLHMDGDKMGKRISACKTLDEHQKFSASLADFADKEVRAIVGKYDDPNGSRAVLVYAGGDDVLALLPLNVAMACADDLRKAFAQLTDCTASAGIAITPYNLPLDNALTMARTAEKIAKDGYGRNAVAITEAHGTGQRRESGAHWVIDEQSIVTMVSTVQNYIKQKKISGKIGYEIVELARELVPVRSNDALAGPLRAAREADLKRLIARRIGEGVSNKEDIINQLHPMLMTLGESEQCGWESLANWIIFARFLASEGKIS